VIVVDASVLATALADDGADGRRARKRLSGERMVAPEVIDLEVVSAWRRLCAAGQVHPDRARQAVSDLEVVPLQRVSHTRFLHRCWGLRDNVTAYGAAYIAIAEAIACTLVTADERLSNAPGARCTFELLR
jgi:predicted nucleic acid-binding protein